MLTYLFEKGRVLFAVLVLACSAGPADAGRRTEPPPATTDAVTSHEPARGRPGDPDAGVAAIALGVALIIFMAWVAARVAGVSQPANDLPE